MEYEFHEWAAIFPMMTDVELGVHAAEIKAPPVAWEVFDREIEADDDE